MISHAYFEEYGWWGEGEHFETLNYRTDSPSFRRTFFHGNQLPVRLYTLFVANFDRILFNLI
jgi:hypothetical protein